MTLTMPKKMDFRKWAAVYIIKAWNGYKDVNGCLADIRGSVNFPEVYCGLLMTAAAMCQESYSCSPCGSAPAYGEEKISIEIPQNVVEETLDLVQRSKE